MVAQLSLTVNSNLVVKVESTLFIACFKKIQRNQNARLERPKGQALRKGKRSRSTAQLSAQTSGQCTTPVDQHTRGEYVGGG